ncbi:MAG: hypothetical protein QM601_07990 [Pseudoxanthomonas sp.]
MPKMPTTAETHYTAGIYVVDGRYLAKKSARDKVARGAITNAGARNVSIDARQDDFNAVLVRGKSHFELADSTIEVHGDGSNDFLGLGAALMTEGGAEMTVRNVHVTTNGLISPAAASFGTGGLHIRDSTLQANGGTLPPGYKPTIGPGMKEVPAPLGITGTARAVLVTGESRTYVDDSTVIAQGWGALSTDACHGAYLEANNTKVRVIKSGYGTYADNGCAVAINHSDFDVATYGGIIAGEAKMDFNDSTVASGGNVVMIHSVMGRGPEVAHFGLHGGDYRSDGPAILVKSANADIVIDGAKVYGKDGTLLKGIVNDDSHATKVNGQKVPGIRVAIRNTTLDGAVLMQDGDRRMQVSLQSATLDGAVVNAELDLDPASRWKATADSKVLLGASVGLSQIDAPAGVVIDAVSAKGAIASGRHVLPGGGKIVVK